MKPSVTREICGTEKGYRKHKNSGEHKCQPCKDAHNVVRRATYNPNKNAQYREKYYSKPEVRQKALKYGREWKRQKRSTSQAIAEREIRKALKSLKALSKEIDKTKGKIDREDARIAQRDADREARAAQKAEERRIRAEKVENERLERENAKKEAKLAKIEAENAEKAAKLAEKEAKRAQKALEKAKRQEILDNQHGTNVNDYYRCKETNGTACEICRAKASEYRRQQVAKDPEKFKRQEKEWKKRNPHKRVTNSRDRAKKKGVEYKYYTRQQIFDRDGYDCYLCGDPTDLTAPHTQGQPGWETYPHIEHVIPLAKGGIDTLDNVKIAHAKCNMDKGVQILEIRTA
jgi:hypothetical protein